MTAKELLERYAAGERDFSGVNLKWANLGDANLKDAKLEGANLRLANLKDAKLEGINFTWVKDI